MTPRYHRQRPYCCTESRLALVHQGFPNDADRRMARPWTTVDEYIVSEGLLNPRRWRQALVGFGTVFLVIVGLIGAAGGFDRMP